MLVTVEGIDGSGKTSAWRALGDAFPEATMTREPTESWYGEAVRRSINDEDADPLAELFLYTADHADHLRRVIDPALAADHLVIADRYSDSRYAYQGATLSGRFDDPMEFVQSVHRPWTRPPDLTVYLDVPPDVGASRSGATNKFEREDHLIAVAENYEQLIAAEPDRFHRVDAERPIEVVVEDVVEIVGRAVNE